jgi:molecular chaperone Hsp33
MALAQFGIVRRFLEAHAGFRVSFVEIRGPMEELRQIQGLLPAAAILLGRATVGTALLAAHLDDDEVISLYFRGDGPIEFVFSECTRRGTLRGFTPKPDVLPMKDGELDLTAALGKGTLTVVRTHPRLPAPQRGTIELQTGSIGEDLAHYLHQSEQRKALVNLAVKLDQSGAFLVAGGVLVDLLPNATEAVAAQLEENWRRSPSVSDMFEAGFPAEQLLTPLLRGFSPIEIDKPTGLEFFCPCNKDRLIRSMRMFSQQELSDIVDKKETTTARCEFCGRGYQLDWQTVKDIRDKRHRSDLQ